MRSIFLLQGKDASSKEVFVVSRPFYSKASLASKGGPAQEKQNQECTYNAKDTEDSEDHCGGIVVSHKVVDSSANTEKDIQDTSNPDELLGECTGKGEVCPGENQRDGENKNEQDDGIGVQREFIARIVYATST